VDTSDNWPKIRNILDVALELPIAERTAYVAAECDDSTVRRQVFSLLAAYNADTSFLDRPRLLGLVAGQAASLGPGDRIGPYLLLEKKGEGGMGAVFLAKRADESFDKQVAIKLLKRSWAGSEEIRRFRVERQILADLEHPHIAKLLDGGSTAEGQPYLVMELVEGEPIDEYCERHALDVDARLRLFLEVCAAVQFAHQKLIVHRDLKPGNILVAADGRPRLLDFGIAKILAPAGFSEPVEETAAGVTPMTPQYASPEQIRGSAVTTSNDVYSLGVILYRLLAGRPPYQFDGRDMKAIVDAVVHREVAAPSTHFDPRAVAERATNRRLRGDLDAIVLKALAKDPQLRYASAEQLADDLRRHLQRLPVRARRGTFGYRAGRFVERHRFALGSALLVFLVLVGSIATLLFQHQRLLDQRNRAVHERNRAETVSSWLVELFGLPDPGRALGNQVTARQLLDKSSATIRQDLAGQPELLATLLATLGETYANLGQLPEGAELLSSAVVHLRQTGAEEARLAHTLHRLAEVLGFEGKVQQARKTAAEALLHAENATPRDPLLVVRCQNQLAHLEHRLGNFEAAAPLFAKALETARGLADKSALAEVLESHAELESAFGRPDAALAAYQEALAIQRQRLDPQHPKISLLETKVTSVVVQREPAAAEGRLREKIAQQRRLYGEVHPFLVGTLGNLGLALLAQRQLDEAERVFREALALVETLYGQRHQDLSALLVNLGTIALQRGDLAAAETSFRRALEIERGERGEESPTYALYSNYLAQVELQRGNLAAARGLLEKALAVTEKSVGGQNPQALLMLGNLAQVAREEKHPAEARDLFARAVAIGRNYPQWPERLRPALFELAMTEYQLGHQDAARTAFEEVVASEGYDPDLGLWSARYLARIELDSGRYPQAEKWARQVLATYEKEGQGDGERATATRRVLGVALLEQGKLDEAEQELERRRRELEKNGATGEQLAKALEDLAKVKDARGRRDSRAGSEASEDGER
jgi:serine/threonine protein kinase/Tfp pilus assembly protein PilF